MKKIILLGLGLTCGLSAIAQLTVVKDAEKAMKAKQPMAKVVEIITPAFTNPETQGEANTWYIPGKAAFNEYDNLLGLETFGKLPEGGDLTMGKNLIEGFGYMMKALPLDSVTDAKGKIKTKYSKDIISTLVGHYNDFNNKAIKLYELQDYDGAYKSWGIYLDMSADPVKFKGINVPGDTLLSEIAYNQALAAYQNKDLQSSLASFTRSIDLGYTKKHIFDYALSVANELADSAMMVKIAKQALPLYGSEDPTYIRFIINDFIVKKDNANALKAIEEAIVTDPNNAEYYVIKGVIYDTQDMRTEAKAAYTEALGVNPDNASANYYFGRALYNDAYDAQDKGPSDVSQMDAYFNNNVRPLLVESATYLEKANELDPDNPDPLKLLENVYYSLNDEAKLSDVQKRLKLL